MLIAAECSSQSAPRTTQFNEDSHKPSKSKPKPRQKDNSKPTPQSERSLKQLEALHERMGVEKSLQLGGGSRIKLKHDLTSEAKPARRPVPKFDVEFSQVAEESTAREPLDIELSDTDSDDDIPGSILDALKKPPPEKKPASSDSADYANSEFDALIAELPLVDGVQQSGCERLASASAGRTGASRASGASDTMDWTPATPSKKREQASPQPSPQAKRGKYTRSSSPPIEVREMSQTQEFALNCSQISSPEYGTPQKETSLFAPSRSDEVLLSRAPARSSPATSPAPGLVDDEEGFTLDTSLFDIMPSTPILDETHYAPRVETSREYFDWQAGRHTAPAHEAPRTTLHSDTALEPAKDEETVMDDPLAELEAWLQSGAVEYEE